MIFKYFRKTKKHDHLGFSRRKPENRLKNSYFFDHSLEKGRYNGIFKFYCDSSEVDNHIPATPHLTPMRWK